MGRTEKLAGAPAARERRDVCGVGALWQDGETPLHRAVELDKLDMVTALLEAGAKTDLRNTVRPHAHTRARAFNVREGR